MTEVKLTIDDVKVIGKEGMMILDAAELAGVNIPTLCHIRGLHPIGGCRICVVEVEGSSRLVGSCHTPIADGMVVKTRSPKVLQTRKTLVELMLAGHTGPCVSDTRIGQCELNSIASGLEVGPPRFQARRARTYPLENASPYLTRDMSKCILCGRCVIACAEIAKKDVFGTGYRGFRSKIVVDCDVVIDKEVCKNCGICAEYCPTSALTIPGVAVQKKAVRAERRDGAPGARAIAPRQAPLHAGEGSRRVRLCSGEVHRRNRGFVQHDHKRRIRSGELLLISLSSTQGAQYHPGLRERTLPYERGAHGGRRPAQGARHRAR